MRIREVTALVLLAAQVGCTSVRLVPAPLQFIPEKQPEIVWVVAANDEVLPISGPLLLRADSLTGTLGKTSERISVSLSQARYVLARQPDPKRTAFLLGGMGLLAGAATIAFITASTGAKDCTNQEKPSGRPWC